MLSEDVLSTLRAEGWRQCAVGQRTTQFCGQMSQAQAAIAELVEALKYARSNGIFATFVISDLDAVIHKHQPTTKE